MKLFYIETDQLTKFTRVLRYVYSENEDGTISFNKVVDPNTKEEISINEMAKSTSPESLLNITTAYLANYERVYF